MKFITVPITEDMRRRAMKHADPLDRGRFVTALSWVALKRAFPKTRLVNHDGGFDVRFRGKLYEVRGDLTRTAPNMGHQHCVFKIRGDVFRYLMVKVSYDKRVAWIIGRISKARFLKQSQFFKAGKRMRLPTGHFYVCERTAYHLPVSELALFSEKTLRAVKDRLL